MRFLGKIGVITLSSLLIHSVVLANTDAQDAQITRYEQAKLRLSYEGTAGNLLQQLSQRLKVGFVAYDVDITQKISIQNQSETAIKAINEQIATQLSDTEIRFEKIGNRLFLMISAKGAEPLLQNEPKKEEQFVGDIVFEGEDTSAAPTSVTTETNAATQENAPATRLQAIFNIATDKTLLEAAKDKKPPQYKTITKENLGLKNIRVTPLGTFLIFEGNVEAAKFKVTGQFEEMAQGENIVAILHQNSNPPTKIEIANAQGKKLVLEAAQTKPQNNKKTKK